MGWEILLALFLVVLAPLTVLGFIAFWALVSRERAHIEEAWQTYAARHDREYVPARGEWPNRTSPSIRWVDQDLRFQLFVVGVEANARTRLVVWPSGKLLGSFVVRPRRGREDERLGSGDAAFESAFVVSTRPAGLALRVLSERARRALLGFWQRDDVVLTYRRGKLILEWPGREFNDARIDEAVRVMRSLANGVEDAFRSTAAVASVSAVLAANHAE